MNDYLAKELNEAATEIFGILRRRVDLQKQMAFRFLHSNVNISKFGYQNDRRLNGFFNLEPSDFDEQVSNGSANAPSEDDAETDSAGEQLKLNRELKQGRSGEKGILLGEKVQTKPQDAHAAELGGRPFESFENEEQTGQNDNGVNPLFQNTVKTGDTSSFANETTDHKLNLFGEHPPKEGATEQNHEFEVDGDQANEFPLKLSFRNDSFNQNDAQECLAEQSPKNKIESERGKLNSSSFEVEQKKYAREIDHLLSSKTLGERSPVVSNMYQERYNGNASKILENGEEFESENRHREAIMKEASRKLDRARIQQKVMSMAPGQLAHQQSSKLQTLLERGPEEAEKMKYYDTLLNMERKCNHFDSLVRKLRLKVVHKPFIILDMLRILEDNRSPFEIFTSLYARFRSSRKRKAFDSIARYVEHRNHLADSWLYLTEKLLDRKKRKVIKEVRARQKAEKGREQRQHVLRRALKFLKSVVENLRKRNERNVIAKIKRRSEEDKEREELEEKRIEAEAKKKLDIAKQQNFYIQKQPPQVEIEQMPLEIQQNPVILEVENTNNLLHKRRESRAPVEPETEAVSRRSEDAESRKSAVHQHHELLSDINNQIVSIKAQLKQVAPNKLLGLKEEIELLGQLTQLMGSLKTYYEFVMDNPHFRESQSTRRNFERVMDLIRRIIEKLSERIQGDNQRRRLESNESRGQKQNWASEAEERRSLLLIDDYSRNIQREMEEIANLFGESQAEEPEEDLGEQIPDQNGINMLLQDMLQNLGQMNHQIEHNVVEEEEEYSETGEPDQDMPTPTTTQPKKTSSTFLASSTSKSRNSTSASCELLST